MTSRRECLRALGAFTLMTMGIGLNDETEAARKRRRAAGKKSPVRKSGATTLSDRTNTIAGMPADVSSIVLVLEGPERFRVLSADEPHARRTPASVTKLMTLAILFDEIEAGHVRPDDMITMPKGNPGGGKLGLAPGRRISVQNAILAIVTKSANDVALAVAEHIAGTEEAFAIRMNLKVHELGMTNSHFVNAHGMRHPDQYASAYDLAMLARYLVQHHARHYHYFSTLSFIFGRHAYPNHNRLMREYKGMDGLKTGMTNHGWQLAASAERIKPADPENGAPAVRHRLIGVFLGGITKQQRNNCLGYLLDQGYVTLGHEMPPSRFRYTEMACTSARNRPPSQAAHRQP